MIEVFLFFTVFFANSEAKPIIKIKSGSYIIKSNVLKMEGKTIDFVQMHKQMSNNPEMKEAMRLLKSNPDAKLPMDARANMEAFAKYYQKEPTMCFRPEEDFLQQKHPDGHRCTHKIIENRKNLFKLKANCGLGWVDVVLKLLNDKDVEYLFSVIHKENGKTKKGSGRILMTWTTTVCSKETEGAEQFLNSFSKQNKMPKKLEENKK
jgi:hypothetical protein